MSSKPTALTDDQRLALIEEAFLEPFDAATKLGVIRFVLDHGTPLPEFEAEAEAIRVTPEKKARAQRRAAAEKTVKNGHAVVAKILGFLDDSDGNVTTEEIAAELGLPAKAVYQKLFYQAKKGVLVQVSPKTWRALPSAKKVR